MPLLQVIAGDEKAITNEFFTCMRATYSSPNSNGVG